MVGAERSTGRMVVMILAKVWMKVVMMTNMSRIGIAVVVVVVFADAVAGSAGSIATPTWLVTKRSHVFVWAAVEGSHSQHGFESRPSCRRHCGF